MGTFEFGLRIKYEAGRRYHMNVQGPVGLKQVGGACFVREAAAWMRLDPPYHEAQRVADLHALPDLDQALLVPLCRLLQCMRQAREVRSGAEAQILLRLVQVRVRLWGGLNRFQRGLGPAELPSQLSGERDPPPRLRKSRAQLPQRLTDVCNFVNCVVEIQRNPCKAVLTEVAHQRLCAMHPRPNHDTVPVAQYGGDVVG